MQTAIQFYDSQKIDQVKWDNCIAKNENGLIYAQYQYLNHLTKQWSAIIIGDYQAILPIPWNIKWGIRYYQAIPFIQQLGLVGQVEINKIPIILKTIQKFASYGDLFFNFDNLALANAVPCIPKTNLVLDLRQDYRTIANKYRKDLVHNLDKAKKHHPIYQESRSYANILALYQKQYAHRFNWVTESDFQQLSQLLSYYHPKQKCLVRELIDQTTEDLLAAAILLKDSKRLYLLINVITHLGRQRSSNHLLIDQIIHEFADSQLLFDFEGSEIPGVNDFYANYQPINQPYFHFHHNQLSWPFSLIKR